MTLHTTKIRQDFEILLDGQIITSPITCHEPILAMPIDRLTDELFALQTFRTAYYMGIGTEGNLPWTQQGLYEWMAAGDAVIANDTIEMVATDISGDLNYTKWFSIKLKGGFDTLYSDNPGITTIFGTLTISSGTLIVDRIVIQ